MSRQQLKHLLEQAGLLGAAREARGFVAGVPWWRHNTAIRWRGAGDGLPVPPLRLVRASTGTSSLVWMLEGGARAAESIVNILERNGGSIGQARRILDFGCGCGRVIRHWSGLHAAVHGSDYNASAVRWCRDHFRFAHFDVNALAPPLPYPDAHFDLVYALSVFTHLPEPLLFEWMHEMERVLAPGGSLVVSTHGEACLDALDSAQQADFRAGRAVVKDEPAAGTNRCGVYVSQDYIRSRMSGNLELIETIPQGARGNPPQDLTLFRKPIAKRAEGAETT